MFQQYLPFKPSFSKYVFEQIVNLVNRLLKTNFKRKQHENNFHR